MREKRQMCSNKTKAHGTEGKLAMFRSKISVQEKGEETLHMMILSENRRSPREDRFRAAQPLLNFAFGATTDVYHFSLPSISFCLRDDKKQRSVRRWYEKKSVAFRILFRWVRERARFSPRGFPFEICDKKKLVLFIIRNGKMDFVNTRKREREGLPFILFVFAIFSSQGRNGLSFWCMWKAYEYFILETPPTKQKKTFRFYRM